jgi:hypothetical protein
VCFIIFHVPTIFGVCPKAKLKKKIVIIVRSFFVITKYFLSTEMSVRKLTANVSLTRPEKS